MLLNRAPKSRYPPYPATATPPNNVICCAFLPIPITPPPRHPFTLAHNTPLRPPPTRLDLIGRPGLFEYIRSQFDNLNGMHFSVPL